MVSQKIRLLFQVLENLETPHSALKLAFEPFAVVANCTFANIKLKHFLDDITIVE